MSLSSSSAKRAWHGERWTVACLVPRAELPQESAKKASVLLYGNTLSCQFLVFSQENLLNHIKDVLITIFECDAFKKFLSILIII